MPRVDWVLLCDLAYFDAYRNVCLIGIQTQPIPTFPIGTRRFALAARLQGLHPHSTASVSISTPDHVGSIPITCERVTVEIEGDHVIVAIGVAPLIDDGVYRFAISLGAHPAVLFDLPILVEARHSPLHLTSDGFHGDCAGGRPSPTGNQ